MTIPESVDTYKMHFGFIVFCKNEFFTKFLQFCKKFIFTIYRSCGLGTCFQWFFSGIMLPPILYVFTDFLASYPDTSTVVVMIPPFPPFFGKKFSVKCVFLLDLKRRIAFTFHFHPIALIDPQRVSPLSNSFRVVCISWIPTPRKCKSIRGLGPDLPVRWQTWAFYGHLACLRSTQDPKSIVICISIYCRRLEFFRSQSYGFKSETFSRNSEQVEFSLTTHLRYIRWSWCVIRSTRSYIGFHPVIIESQNPSGFRRILRFTERRTYPKCAGIPAHFDSHMLALSRFWFRSFVSWIRGHIRHIWLQYKQQIYKHSYPRTRIKPPEFYTFTCPLCMCHYSQPLSRLEFLSIIFYWLLCFSVIETCVL